MKISSTTRKFDRMAGLAFENALRLHTDSMILFQAGSFPSAFALSILAMEELAKADLIEWVVFHARSDEMKIDEELWKMIKGGLFSHTDKQRIFGDRAHLPRRHDSTGTPIRTSRFWRLCQSGKLDIMKQDAFYVGLARQKNKKAPFTRIINPLKIGAAQPKRFITIVNDYLLDIMIGQIFLYKSVDADSVEDQISGEMCEFLLDAWRPRSRVGHDALRNAKKLGRSSDEEYFLEDRRIVLKALKAMS